MFVDVFMRIRPGKGCFLGNFADDFVEGRVLFVGDFSGCIMHCCSPVQQTLHTEMMKGSERLRVVAGHLRADMEAKEDSSISLFDKILRKEIPSTPVYEDDQVYAFRDISPEAPVHVVIIPKNKNGLVQLSKAEEKHKEILGHLLYTAKVIAHQEGLKDGYRVVINDGPNGCQTVYHLHLHLLGGRQMRWPPG